MPSWILALLCLVTLLEHVAIVTAIPVADESLDAVIETGPEISVAVENENTQREVVEHLEKDKRQVLWGPGDGQPGQAGYPGDMRQGPSGSGGPTGPRGSTGLLNEEDKRWGPGDRVDRLEF